MKKRHMLLLTNNKITYLLEPNKSTEKLSLKLIQFTMEAQIESHQIKRACFES